MAKFVALGAREVTLIGQNVNSYHGAGAADEPRGRGTASPGRAFAGGAEPSQGPEEIARWRGTASPGRAFAGGAEPSQGSEQIDFAALLAMVDAVPGLLRVRFTTSHPKDFTPKVAEAFRDLPRLGSWLHLPVQSGSTRTLRRMVRGYTREEYLARVEHVRELVPDLSLSTDIIVGYPGETDADFRETMTLLERCEFDSIYSFEYSERPDTPAQKLKLRDDVPAQVKAERLQEVQALQRGITARRLARFVGRQVEVLVEGASSRHAGQACGRSSGGQMVNFPLPCGSGAEALAGRLVRVRI